MILLFCFHVDVALVVWGCWGVGLGGMFFVCFLAGLGVEGGLGISCSSLLSGLCKYFPYSLE
jgi:hypothetical protein